MSIDLDSSSTGFINGNYFSGIHCSNWFIGLGAADSGNVANNQFYGLSVESSTRGIDFNDASFSSNYLQVHYDGGTVTTASS